MQLNNNDLLPNKAYVNGQWINANSGKTFDVFNPFDESIIATLPEMGQQETQQAIAAADAAFAAWRDTPPADRKMIIDQWVTLIQENLQDLCVILTTEQGKPLAQSEAEYLYMLDNMSFYAGEALRVHGQTLPSVASDKTTIVLRQPFGVVAGVSPWNFPASTTMNKVAPALAAGNTIVVKPAQDTPLTTLALTVLAEQAGVPKGVLNVIVADNPKAIGDELTSNPIIKKFSFTGSTAVGKMLYAQCGSTVKNIALELGGNSPFIVFDDADVSAAAAGGAGIKFTNCGQICVNANRFFVHEKVYDEFVEKFTQHAKAHVLGSGLNDKTTMGPLINQKALCKVEALVKEAVAQGATIVTGGKRSDVGNNFYEPTVLTNVNENMRIYREEIFGPVAPIYKFSDEQEVVEKANDTNYGLAAYFYTQSLGRAWRVSNAIDSGTVAINAAGGFGGGPFGGYKESGLGRESGRVSALNDWCEVKTISIAGLDK